MKKRSKEKNVEVSEDINYSVIPLKDWHIVQNNYNIRLIKDEPITVPEIFYETLITEKVIKR